MLYFIAKIKKLSVLVFFRTFSYSATFTVSSHFLRLVPHVGAQDFFAWTTTSSTTWVPFSKRHPE